MFRCALPVILVVCLCAACSSGKTQGANHDHHPGEVPSQASHRQHDPTRHQMPHDFSDAEHWSKVFDDPNRDAKQMPGHVVDSMHIEPGMTVVDIGAGTGYFLPYLSKAAGKDGTVLALDIAQSLVDHMNRRAEKEGLGNVQARLAAPDNPKLEPQSVDRVLVVNTWHHLPDQVAYTKKLATALSPRGVLFIVDFTMESEDGPPQKHRILPSTLIETLGRGGLRATLVKEELPDQYIVSAHLPR